MLVCQNFVYSPLRNNNLMKSKAFLFTCVITITLFLSCAKKTIQGPQGDPGAPGGGGNAGISASSIFTVTTTQWQKTADSTSWQYTINSDLITTDIVDKGTVKVFALINNAWWELPYTEGDLFTQFGFSLGKANLLFADIHGGLPTRPDTKAYRLVTISALARQAHPTTNWSNYYELSLLFESHQHLNQ